MNTLLLDLLTWDLLADADGNIAMASDPYSAAQDVASAARTFLGECFYNTTLGLPYWQSVLGKFPPVSLIKAQYVLAANTVPGVTSAVCYLSSITNRSISGQIQFTDSNGTTQTVGVTPTTRLSEYAVTDTAALGVTDSGQSILVG